MGYMTHVAQRAALRGGVSLIGWCLYMTIFAPLAVWIHDSPRRVPANGDADEDFRTVSVQWWGIFWWAGLAPLVAMLLVPLPVLSQVMAVIVGWLIARRLCAARGLILDRQMLIATLQEMRPAITVVGLALPALLLAHLAFMALVQDHLWAPHLATWAWSVIVGAWVGTTGLRVAAAELAARQRLSAQLAAVLGVSAEEIGLRLSYSNLGTDDAVVEVRPLPERAATQLSSGRIEKSLLDALPEMGIEHLGPDLLRLHAVTEEEREQRALLARTDGLILAIDPPRPSRLPRAIPAGI